MKKISEMKKDHYQMDRGYRGYIEYIYLHIRGWCKPPESYKRSQSTTVTTKTTVFSYSFYNSLLNL